MFCFSQVFYTIFSSVLLSLSIPNEFFSFGSPFFGLIALVPLYISVSRSKSYKQIFWLCFIHGGLTHLLSSFWLANFQGMAAFTLGASLIGTGFIEAFCGWVIYYPFSKANKEKTSSLIKVFWFSSSYVFYEWCKSTGFLAYPWGTLSMSAVSCSLIVQIADITTQYGISFLFALFSAFLGEKILLSFEKNIDKNLRLIDLQTAAKAILILFGFSLFYGIYQYTKPRTVHKKINTVLVQQNMDTYRVNELDAITLSQHLTKAGIAELREKNLKPDLVVWSEGVLNRYFPLSQKYYERKPDSKPLMKFIKELRVPFIIGSSTVIDEENHKYGNSAALISRDGQYLGSYIKLHLVPFAEAIPFVEYPLVRKFIKKIAGFSYGWTQGNKYTVFEIPVSTPTKDLNGTEIISATKTQTIPKINYVYISAPICFDDAYNDVFAGLYRAGTEVFMNITNDSWSQTRSAEYQHYAVSFYRAIEFRTTFVRCTNSGYTAVIDPKGKILKDLPLFKDDYLAMQIPVYERTTTIAYLFGDWICYVIMIFLIFNILKIHFSFFNKKF